MSDKKATFEARDLSSPSFNELTGEGKRYVGPERRHRNRRTGEDRRGDVRFEGGKGDRRNGKGRRRTDDNPAFW